MQCRLSSSVWQFDTDGKVSSATISLISGCRLTFRFYESRTTRHDYLNHLQVVYGLVELEEYQELKEYIKPVYKDMLKTGKALKTSKPALNALLKAKMEEAENKQIDVYVEVKSDLKSLSIEDWQLCKVLSNLIDNAITALQVMQEEKRIEIDINESREAYIINLSMISKIEAYGRWTYTVKLKNTHNTALMTAQKYDDVKRLYE